MKLSKIFNTDKSEKSINYIENHIIRSPNGKIICAFLQKCKFHIFYFLLFSSWFYLGYKMNKNHALEFSFAFLWYILPVLYSVIALVYIIFKLIRRNIQDVIIALILIPLTFVYCEIGLNILSYKPNSYELFEKNHTEMLEVVELVKTGKIPIVEYGSKLPGKYSHLSDGGEIIIKFSSENDYEIEFYIYRGILGSHHGYIYTQVDNFEKSIFFNGYDMFENIALNWYLAIG